MQISNAVKVVFTFAAVFAILAGCSSGGSQLTPSGLSAITSMPLDGRPAPDAAQRGIYVSSFSLDFQGGSTGTGQVWVYSGCNPTCALVGGPFPLFGQSGFGHLNHLSTRFATADYQRNQVDIYS